MFWHIFINRLKCSVRDKTMLFWTFVFPLLLATLFDLALGNIASSEKFEAIPIAVVDNADYQKDPAFQAVLESVTLAGETVPDNAQANGLFQVTLTKESEAEDLLKNNKVVGYILIKSQKPELVVKGTGLNQTIVKQFLDEYIRISAAYETILSQHPEKIATLMNSGYERQRYTIEVSANGREPDIVLNYFYALIGMACLYGGFWGLKEVSAIQANQSPQGARTSLAPVHKLKVFVYSLSAVTLIQILSILILLAYLILILKVDFGPQLGYVLLTCVVGCLAGASMGSLIGAATSKSENFKIAVLIMVSMLCSFLAGLMVADIKYVVASAAPIVSYLNPANMITDAFYSLYFFDTYTRFFTNIGLLIAFSAICSLIVYVILRRQKYASL